jgi:hypothetical protein
MSAKTVVIACQVMEPELEAFKPEGVEIRYLPQGLHNTPKQMPERLQEQIDLLPQDIGRLVLAYGLCSMGVTGIIAPECGMYIPKAHDCITILLGSLEAYAKAQKEQVGTYWLTPGWVAEKQDPLGFMHGKYSERVGPEMAERAVHIELQNYTHISLINTGVGDIEALQRRTKLNADHFGKIYSEVRGDPRYFRRILQGPWDDKHFFYFPPGQKVTQNPWMECLS